MQERWQLPQPTQRLRSISIAGLAPRFASSALLPPEAPARRGMDPASAAAPTVAAESLRN